MRLIRASILVCVFALLAPSAQAVVFVKGTSLSASNFRVLDPLHAGFKSSASSDNYRLLSTIGDVAIGSSSGTSFGLRSGFLYFPLVIAPSMTSATGGDTEVDLVWTTATMDAGWTLSGYNVCTKPPAGSFTCEDVGNVTSFTKSGLTNGTTYTFKVQAKEIFGEVIAESGEISGTPSGAPTPTPTPTPVPGGGGGGGGIPPPVGNSLQVRGWAYPGAVVTILQDGVLVGTDIGNTDGSFNYNQGNITTGTYTFGFWAIDTAGRRSVILSIPLTFSGNSAQNISNIIVAPTIEFTTANSLDTGEPLGIRGAATPNSRVRIRVNPGGLLDTVLATGDTFGTYEYTFDTSGRSDGGYDISARTELAPNYLNVSQYSQLLPFGIGVPAPDLPGLCSNPPDINRDTRVNLIDFSILAFWWKREPLPAARPFDLNCDDRVRLDDFSILAFHWTG